MSGRSLLEELRDTVASGNLRKARRIAEQITIKCPSSTKRAVEKMVEAMEAIDKRYQLKQCSVADVIAAASAMREALKILEPHLEAEKARVKAKIVIGALKGNTHGLGKDIVAAALKAAGFHVHDLDVDVAPEAFVEAAVREKAEVIAVSVTVSETAKHLGRLIEELEAKGLRGKVKVIVGGKGVSEQTCSEYGIEAYASDAWDCVKKAEKLVSGK